MVFGPTLLGGVGTLCAMTWWWCLVTRVIERHPVSDDRQRAGSILRREGVGVRVVSRRIDRGQRRLSMRGAKAQRHRDRQRSQRGEECELPHFVLLAAVDYRASSAS